MKASMASIQVVAAHPDDEVHGCGGTIATIMVDDPVQVLIVAVGATSRQEQRDRFHAAGVPPWSRRHTLPNRFLRPQG